MYDILELSKKLLPELREIGKELNIKRVESFKKQDLVYKILDIQAINASVIKKPEVRVTPRLPESDIREIDEPVIVENLTEKIEEPEPILQEEAKIPAEKTPIIKSLRKKSEEPRIDPSDKKEKRPRVLRTETAIASAVVKPVTESEKESPSNEIESPVTIAEPQIEIKIHQDQPARNNFHKKPQLPPQGQQKQPSFQQQKPVREAEKKFYFEGIISASGVMEIMQ